MKNFTFSIDAGKSAGKVSDTLFGLFLEDINYSCDGGLNANMVRNHSFDDVNLKKANINNIKFVIGKVGSLEREPAYLRFWDISGCNISSKKDDSASENSRYARIKVSGTARIENKGYTGKALEGCGMSIVSGHTYTFSAYNRSRNFDGVVTVVITDEKNGMLTNKVKFAVSSEWENSMIELDGISTGYGKLIIEIRGTGTLDLDCIQLYDNDYWGNDDPKWSQGKMRKDLVCALKELKPQFLRFPGGCIIEGLDTNNEYHWKESVGPLIDRKQEYNLWAYEEPGFAYTQSRQIGFYEFFLLCEDLNMEPLPVVWAGMNCQMRKRSSVPFESKQFDEEVVQNALDLIEYANGNPATSRWAKLRAEAGHPESFNMKFIGIGNENFGEDYLRRFRKVKNAIDEAYPGITCVIGTGSEPKGKNFDYTWQETKKDLGDVYVDEHFYKKPSWVIDRHTRYDSYPRDGAKVFLGEYAAYDVVMGNFNKNYVGNRYETALAEAAFLTGIERNADIVAMTCYAPLFAQIGGEHWKHNLIYFNPKTVMHTANYYVQQMFGTTIGEEMVPVECSLPKNVFASATKSDNYLCMKLVNTGKNDYETELNFENTGNCKKAKITTLQCDNLKQKNTIEFSGEPDETICPKSYSVSIDELNRLILPKQSVIVIQLL